jgi:ferritin-like protein
MTNIGGCQLYADERINYFYYDIYEQHIAEQEEEYAKNAAWSTYREQTLAAMQLSGEKKDEALAHAARNYKESMRYFND